MNFRSKRFEESVQRVLRRGVGGKERSPVLSGQAADHHELPAELPGAQALLNPRLLPPGHPLSSLPGVGVAYKLVDGTIQTTWALLPN